MNDNIGNSRKKKEAEQTHFYGFPILTPQTVVPSTDTLVHTWVPNIQFHILHLSQEASSIAYSCREATIATEHILQEKKRSCNLRCDSCPIVSGCLELHMGDFLPSPPLNVRPSKDVIPSSAYLGCSTLY